MQALGQLEMAVLEWLYALHGNAFFDGLMLFVSWLGNGGMIFIALSVVMLCIRRTRILGGICGTALALDALVVNAALKPLVARARPFADGVFELLLEAPTDYSFPSGHTAAAFAFAFALAPAGKKWSAAAIAFACLTGFSRMYLTVHCPMDVLCGAVIGALCGRAALFLWKKALRRDII